MEPFCIIPILGFLNYGRNTSMDRKSFSRTLLLK